MEKLISWSDEIVFAAFLLFCSIGLIILIVQRRKAIRSIHNLIEEEKKYNLFNPATTNHECFAIKGEEAFIGYRIPNGNFCFESIKYTEPNNNKNNESNEKTGNS